jgi:hypothetical protein
MLARGFKAWCENMSLQLRVELKLAKTDPLRPEVLAKYLNVLLWRPEDLKGLSQNTRTTLLGRERDSWSAVTLSYAGIIVIIHNSAHKKGRKSSDVMHELSHIIIGHRPDNMVLSQDGQFTLREYDRDKEDEAQWLMGCLLLPREALLLIRRQRMSTEEACEIYGVSDDLLSWRTNVTAVDRQLSRYRA